MAIWGENFFRKKFLGRVINLSMPVMLGMLSQVLMNIIDTVFVGRIGPRADQGLAALGLGIIGMWVIGGALNAISVGIQALSARRFGENNYIKAGKVAFNGLILALFLGSLFGIVGTYFAKQIAGLLSSDPGVVSYCYDFLKFRFLGLIPFLTIVAMKSFFDGIGYTKVYMFTSFAMNLVNIFVSYGFILGGLGFPRLEVGGAGLAATLSGTIGMFIIISISFLPYFRKFTVMRISNFSPAIIKSIIKISYPSSVAAFFTALGFLFFLRIVGIIGTIEQAASTILINIASLSFLPTLALGTASATLVGQSLGARKPVRGTAYGVQSVKLGAVIMGILGVIAFILARPILQFFTEHYEVINAGIKALRILAIAQIFQATGLIFAQSLLGSGDTRYVMIADVSLHYLFLLPLTYLLGVKLGFGIYGAWIAMDFYILGLAVTMTTRFLSGQWQKIKI